MRRILSVDDRLRELGGMVRMTNRQELGLEAAAR